MFLSTFVFFITLCVFPITTKVPWSSYFCEIPDWYCDNKTVNREVVEKCLDDCLIYRYCASNRWCVYNTDLSETIDKENIDLVIIDFSKFLPRCMIKNLPKLKTIYGKNKDIVFVDPWAFWNLPQLKEINLSYNFIKGIDYGSFSKLSSVESLDLSWNEIEYIGQGSFQGMTNLRKLDLSRNYINRFDAAYYFSLTNSGSISLALEELNLSHNQLKFVLNLNSFQRLSVINLSHNTLSVINWTSILHPSQWLTKLDLSDNYLYKFDMDLPDVYIDKLRIPFNEMYLPDAINVVGRINVVVLDGNLWQCEAYTELLEKFLKMQTTILGCEEDEDIYFLTKFERENYPVCFVSSDSDTEPVYRRILSLESTYKTNKNPRCNTKNRCPKDMFCKSGRCWKGCEQNICDETAICVSDYHGFFCHCPRGKIRNPFVTETRCYNVQCFTNEDCFKFGIKACNKKSHTCEKV